MLNKYVVFWKKSLSGSQIDIIYLNFQTAFEKVLYQRLLLKFKAHSIGDGIIDWIEQWLAEDSEL